MSSMWIGVDELPSNARYLLIQPEKERKSWKANDGRQSATFDATTTACERAAHLRVTDYRSRRTVILAKVGDDNP